MPRLSPGYFVPSNLACTHEDEENRFILPVVGRRKHQSGRH